MNILHLYEMGKGTMKDDKIGGTAQVVINADGTKPRLFARFDDNINELVGELVLVPEWNKTFPTHYTIGRKLRNDYADALKMIRGIFLMKAHIKENLHFGIDLSFIDSSTQEFATLNFQEVDYDATSRMLAIPHCENDDHEVFLEEAMVGILYPAFLAVTNRCMKYDFVPHLHYGFTLNKYGVPVDTRNRIVEQVRG